MNIVIRYIKKINLSLTRLTFYKLIDMRSILCHNFVPDTVFKNLGSWGWLIIIKKIDFYIKSRLMSMFLKSYINSLFLKSLLIALRLT